MDFDDLLMKTVVLFREHADVLEHYHQRFEHILVDEYQDTNQAQNEMVLMLAGGHQNVCVVGDTDQSVYRFRGADFRNILQFEQAFPDVTTVVLDQNYRSTQTILDAANAVIDNNTERKPKSLWTDAGARRADRPLPRRGRGRRGPLGRLDDAAAAARRRRQLARDGGALPHERPEPRDRGGVHAPRRAVQGGRRHPLLRPPGDQGCDGVPAGRRQPGRRGERQAGPQRAQARRSATRASPSSTRSPRARGSRSWTRCGAPTKPASPGRRCVASPRSSSLIDRLGAARRRRVEGSGRRAAGGARRLRLPRRDGGGGHGRGAHGRIENLGELVGRPASSR